MKKLIALAVCALSALAAHAETYVLSIGINDYPEIKQADGEVYDSDLTGCVNDANYMQSLFSSKFGVKPQNMRVLTDDKANLNNLVENLKWLITTAKAGDQIVFTYSGHGAQVEVETSEEADGIQEVLVLADMNLIPGSLFGEIAKTMTLNGIHSTFVFDSCFSGGMSRSVDGKVKARVKTLGVLKPKSASKVKDAASKVRGIVPKSKGQGTAESAFLFASKETNPSSDISGLEGIEPHGLFTLLLMDVMNANPQASLRDMYDYMDASLAEINESFKKNNVDMQFDQGPNFEASAARSSQPIILKK